MRWPGYGEASVAVTGRPGIGCAFAGSSTVAPRIEIPLTRKFFIWKPIAPPNENAAVPCSEKTSCTVPLNGALIFTCADGMFTSTLLSGLRVKLTLPSTLKIPPRSILSPFVVGAPLAPTPTENFST